MGLYEDVSPMKFFFWTSDATGIVDLDFFHPLKRVDFLVLMLPALWGLRVTSLQSYGFFGPLGAHEVI